MKYKLLKGTIALADTLDEDYKQVYNQLIETITDDDYTKSEINFFIRKTTHELLDAMKHEQSVDEFTSHNPKKWAIEKNKVFREWHVEYDMRMKKSDRVTYAGFLSMVAYSITLVCITAVSKGVTSNWLWILVPAIGTIALMLLKILYARALSLKKLHTYGDILMFAFITLICFLSTIYFIIFLWIYEVSYMIYLQLHIVEEDI